MISVGYVEKIPFSKKRLSQKNIYRNCHAEERSTQRLKINIFIVCYISFNLQKFL